MFHDGEGSIISGAAVRMCVWGYGQWSGVTHYDLRTSLCPALDSSRVLNRVLMGTHEKETLIKRSALYIYIYIYEYIYILKYHFIYSIKNPRKRNNQPIKVVLASKLIT